METRRLPLCFLRPLICRESCSGGLRSQECGGSVLLLTLAVCVWGQPRGVVSWQAGLHPGKEGVRLREPAVSSCRE